MNNTCIIIPTYNEHLNIENVLYGLFQILPNIKNFIIVDDSPNTLTQDVIYQLIQDEPRREIKFIKNAAKMGRGYAVNIGLVWAIENLKNCTHFIEMDADGSHSPEMVFRLTHQNPNLPFIIGSRYLSESRITGWPSSRRKFSIFINRALQWIFKYRLTDWTNGLRRYSRESAEILTNVVNESHGFIHLTEQILLLRKHAIFALEVPIDFCDRHEGSSSVTKKDLMYSVKDVLTLYRKFQFRKNTKE
jgi:dolichol-phosphate mannosyltransferase